MIKILVFISPLCCFAGSSSFFSFKDQRLNVKVSFALLLICLQTFHPIARFNVFQNELWAPNPAVYLVWQDISSTWAESTVQQQLNNHGLSDQICGPFPFSLSSFQSDDGQNLLLLSVQKQLFCFVSGKYIIYTILKNVYITICI